MNKILLISLAVVLVLGIGLVGCGGGGGGGAEPSDTIVIGSSRSMTGPFSSIHAAAFGMVGPAYTGWVNGRTPNAGINVGGTYFDMDYEFKNDGSNEGTLSANILTLINGINAGTIHTIFGPTCTHFIDVVAPICNDAGVVLITVEGGATFLMSTGYLDTWPYVFISLSFSNWYQLPVLGPLLDEQHANASVYTCWERDAHGQEYLAAAWGDPVKGITGSFTTVGLVNAGDSSVLNSADPAGWANTLLTSKIIPASPDVVCLFCYPDEIWAILGASKSLNFTPEMWVVGPGGNFGFFGASSNPPFLPPSFSASAEGMMCFAVANNKTSPAMADMFNTKLATPFGISLNDYWGHPCYWAACQMWEAAVGAVGNATSEGFLIDQTALKNKLASYNAAPGVTTVLGQTWFRMMGTGGGLIDYKCHTGEIGQWQSGYVEVIAPIQVLDETYSLVATGTYLPRYTATSNSTVWPWPGWVP